MIKTLVYWCAGEYDVIDGEKHFIPSVIIDGEKGHRPMRGKDSLAVPYYRGKTEEECQARCTQANEDMGIDEKTAAIIVGRSMF